MNDVIKTIADLLGVERGDDNLAGYQNRTVAAVRELKRCFEVADEDGWWAPAHCVDGTLAGYLECAYRSPGDILGVERCGPLRGAFAVVTSHSGAYEIFDTEEQAEAFSKGMDQ